LIVVFMTEMWGGLIFGRLRVLVGMVEI